MPDEKLKNREDQVDDNEPSGQGAEDEHEASIRREDGKPPVVEVQQESRAERRARERRQEMERIVEERNRPVLDQLTALARRLDGIGTVMAQPQARQQETPKPQDVDPEFMKIRRRQGEIMSLIQNAKTQTQIDELEREYYRLDQDALDARARKQTEEMREQFKRDNPPRVPHEIEVVRTEFPDVIGNEAAANWASTLFRQAELEAGGKPFDRIATHRRCLQASGEKYGIRRPAVPAARPSEQGRFGGVPPANSGRSGGVVTRALTEHERAVAMAAAPKGTTQEEAEEMWVKKVLKARPNYFKDT
jgi:hypothetical protein